MCTDADDILSKKTNILRMFCLYNNTFIVYISYTFAPLDVPIMLEKACLSVVRDWCPTDGKMRAGVEKNKKSVLSTEQTLSEVRYIFCDLTFQGR